MKFQINRKETTRKRLILLFAFVPILLACATGKAYDETVLQWRSYEDVARWMSIHFSYDMARLKETEGKGPLVIPPRSPEETFRIKSGVCYDAALFARETLNRIAPSYEAEIVCLDCRPYISHFVCAFKRNGKLFIIDYGIPYRNMVGVQGPYNSLEEYKKFYEKYYPWATRVRSISYWDLEKPL